ncbi:MAG: hypothetical protein ACD_2C00091G0009 [uncultured bacterium (gcode 4)]|uniref:Uncharacterized protein n=1 Tax=uncultured bacterium (gcode 4) TaxID=1234023 RepID=K2G3K7_9BACT|nr:MAG: hypothetical protein ACD_2C00091G0009 [uncultured bacterium (gcode 4)]
MHRMIPVIVYMILPIVSFITVLFKFKPNPIKFITIIHLWLLISIITSSLASPQIMIIIYHDLPIWIYPLMILLSGLAYMSLWRKFWTYYIISVLLQDFSMILIGYHILYILNIPMPLMMLLVAIPYLIAHVEKIHKSETRKLPYLLIFCVIVGISIFMKLPWYIFISHIIGWTYLIKKGYILEGFIKESM